MSQCMLHLPLPENHMKIASIDLVIFLEDVGKYEIFPDIPKD